MIQKSSRNCPETVQKLSRNCPEIVPGNVPENVSEIFPKIFPEIFPGIVLEIVSEKNRRYEFIPRSLICNGEFDCTDGSDEFTCRQRRGTNA